MAAQVIAPILLLLLCLPATAQILVGGDGTPPCYRYGNIIARTGSNHRDREPIIVTIQPSAGFRVHLCQIEAMARPADADFVVTVENFPAVPLFQWQNRALGWTHAFGSWPALSPQGAWRPLLVSTRAGYPATITLTGGLRGQFTVYYALAP